MPGLQKYAGNSHAFLTLSQWLMNNITKSNMSTVDMATKIDFLNRSMTSKRVRRLVAELVSSLAPYCLPRGDVWNIRVDDIPLWAPLTPRPSPDDINGYCALPFPHLSPTVIFRFVSFNFVFLF